MKASEAVTYLDGLRRIVLTVQGPNGPQAASGADHDVWREAINVLRCEHPLEPPKPAAKAHKDP